MPTATLEHARRLWSYMSSGRAHAPCDGVVVCCSYDLRVCDYACDLVKQNQSPRLILSGNTGNWTRHLYATPEAHVFRDRALSNGIDASLIKVEDRSTNFGENIFFARGLLPRATRITFVTKPNSVLRVRLTVPIQWPGIAAWVDAPPLSFPQDVSNVIGLFGLIDEMVGDIDRILQYPAKGFQLPHDVPAPVLESWSFLTSQGFTRHLLQDPGR